jgi:hypothetical protein
MHSFLRGNDENLSLAGVAVTPLCPGGAGAGGGRIADDRRPSHPIIDRSAAEGEITEAGA